MKQIKRAAIIAAIIEAVMIGLALIEMAIESSDPKGGIIGYLVLGLHLPGIALAETVTDQTWLEIPLTIIGAWLMWFVILLPALVLANIGKKTPNQRVQTIDAKASKSDP